MMILERGKRDLGLSIDNEGTGTKPSSRFIIA
jgi:hypothetical protein